MQVLFLYSSIAFWIWDLAYPPMNQQLTIVNINININGKYFAWPAYCLLSVLQNQIIG